MKTTISKHRCLKTLFTVVVETDTSSSSSIDFVTGTVCSFSFYNSRSRNHTLQQLGGASKNKSQNKSLFFGSRNMRHQYQANADLKVGKPNDSSPSNANLKVGKPNDSSPSPIISPYVKSSSDIHSGLRALTAPSDVSTSRPMCESMMLPSSDPSMSPI